MVNTQLDAAVRHLRRLPTREEGRAGTDGELLAAFTARNDQAAFAGLVKRYGPLVLGICRRVLRQEQDAEDAFQATFLVLVKEAGSIRDRDVLGTWLYRVARRVAGPDRGPAATGSRVEQGEGESQDGLPRRAGRIVRTPGHHR